MCRRLLAALAPLLVAACQLAPEGRCERDGDCLAGQHCSASICVSNLDTGDVGASCAADADCASWADCQDNRCVLAVGACFASADCPSWKTCTDHACVLIPGKCAADAHCASWQACNVAKLACAPEPGRCGVEMDCAAWQDCDGSNTCVTGAGFCATSGDCVAPRECGADHVCAFPPGVCDVATDCHGGQTCEAHVCVDPPLAALDPATVVLWGTLEEGQIGLGVLGRLDAATIPHPGFGGSSQGLRAFITGAGELLYTQHDSGDRERIRTFRQDSFAWDASASRWLYPAQAAANDPEVPTPACDGATTLTSWVVQRATGDVLYACGGTTYFDSTGATRLEGYTLHAWQSVSEMLVTTTDGTTTTWLVFDELSRNEFPLVDFALAPGDTVVAVRTTVAGFYLLVQSAAGTLSLWQVGAFFPAFYLGEYPAVTGYTIAQLALDADGALHVLATDDASPGTEVVLRLTLPTATPPSETSIVYSEANAPEVAWSTTDPPSFFVFADPATSRLVTGP